MALGIVAFALAFQSSRAPGSAQSGVDELANISRLAKSADVRTIRMLEPYLTDPNKALRLPAAKAIRAIADREAAFLKTCIDSAKRAETGQQIQDRLVPIIVRIEAVRPYFTDFTDFSPGLIVRLANDRSSKDQKARTALVERMAAEACRPDGDFELDEAYSRTCGTTTSQGAAFSAICQENPAICVQLLQKPAFRFKRELIGEIGEFTPGKEMSAEEIQLSKVLVHLTKNEWSEVREAATCALSGCNQIDAKQAVVAAAYDRYAFVRMASAQTILDTAPEFAQSILRMLAIDRVEEVRNEALARLEPL